LFILVVSPALKIGVITAGGKKNFVQWIGLPGEQLKYKCFYSLLLQKCTIMCIQISL